MDIKVALVLAEIEVRRLTGTVKNITKLKMTLNLSSAHVV